MCCESRLDDRGGCWVCFVLYGKVAKGNENQLKSIKTNENLQKPTKKHLQRLTAKEEEKY